MTHIEKGDHSIEESHISPPARKSHGRRRTVYISGLLAALGGFICGYDTGAVAGILSLPTFVADFPDLNAYLKSVLLVMTLALGGLGALSSAYFCDKIGRKYSIIVSCFVFAAGVLMQVIGMKYGVLLAGRIIAGIGNGIITNSIPLYHSEIAPADIRGRLISLYTVMKSFGTLIGYFVTYGTSFLVTSWGWRAPWLIELLLCVGLGIFSFTLPFSPRWLIYQGRDEESLQVLSDLREAPINDVNIQAEFNEIKQELDYERSLGQATVWELFQGTNRKRTLISFTLALGAALTGTQAVRYFAPTVFKSAGLSSVSSSLVATCGVGAFGFLGTLVTVTFLDRWGRKPILLSGTWMMCISMMMIGAMFQAFSHMDAQGNIIMTSVPARNAIMAFLFIFSFCYSYSLGIVSFVVPSEIFNMRCRAKGCALTFSIFWIFSIFTTLIMPVFSAHSASAAYFFFGACCFVAGVWYFFVPESKDITLEQMEQLFSK
ncbi:general substrate transporter [Umbelopsis sp. AD052]|nr:general substrate transporter [Umbelopsis sp. AD052]